MSLYYMKHTGSPSVHFCKRSIQRIFFGQTYGMVFPTTAESLPHPHSHQAEALPHFHYAIQTPNACPSWYGLDTVKRSTCFWNSGLQISQIPQHVTFCEDVSRRFMEGMPLQRWTHEHDMLQRAWMQWASGMACTVRQERCILNICKIIEIPVTGPLRVVYWLQPSNTFCIQVIYFKLYWGYATCNKMYRF